MKLLTYYHTIKYLKVSQIYFRILKRFTRPKAAVLSGSVPAIEEVARTSNEQLGEAIGWQPFYYYTPRLFEHFNVSFLNVKGKVSEPTDWNDDSHEKLWLYNLHYFDDLSAIGAPDRTELQQQLIQRWIQENPVAFGNGWEPYPNSLRIVNWVKGFMSHLTPEQSMLDSLATQAQYLSQDIEYHILGNHLFANAKALTFAGCYFAGKRADKWRATGLRIINEQVDEQILADGGHFELSPMYHVIMLMDILDLLNLFNAYPSKIKRKQHERLVIKAQKMLEWLKAMCHNDGDIALFNDSALGIAATPQQIWQYAEMLGLSVSDSPLPSLVKLEQSGYSRLTMPEHSMIFDHAKVGPDYLPGHAHADSLSVEWSVGTQRVLVNSGTSVYGLSEERLRQRKTAAHNTVVVDHQDSSQVWSGFRVAKRAYCKDVDTTGTNERVVKISASHDGYKRLAGNVVHERKLLVAVNSVDITDKLSGKWKSAEAMFHLHPDVTVKLLGDSRASLSLPDGTHVKVSCSGTLAIEKTTWHPKFGVSIPNEKLVATYTDKKLETTFKFTGRTH